MFTKLSEAEAERVAHLAEEAAEVIKAAMKILRHGWVAIDYSVEPAVHYDNCEDLNTELRDLIKAAWRMVLSKDIHADILRQPNIEELANNKYMHYQVGELPTQEDQEWDLATARQACVVALYGISIGNPPTWRPGTLEQVITEHLHKAFEAGSAKPKQ